MTLQEKIKKYRKEKGWSQAELANRVGVTTGHISRLENGHFQPSIELLKGLAHALDVTADYLLNEEEGDFLTPVKAEDKSLVERIRLIDSLDSEEKSALMRIIDALLTKKKMVDLALQERRASIS